MALSNAQFQNYLAQWVDDINSLAQAVQTWADNKNDVNSSFDFTTAKTDLDSAKASFESSVTTVKGL